MITRRTCYFRDELVANKRITVSRTVSEMHLTCGPASSASSALQARALTGGTLVDRESISTMASAISVTDKLSMSLEDLAAARRKTAARPKENSKITAARSKAKGKRQNVKDASKVQRIEPSTRAAQLGRQRRQEQQEKARKKAASGIRGTQRKATNVPKKTTNVQRTATNAPKKTTNVQKRAASAPKKASNGSKKFTSVPKTAGAARKGQPAASGGFVAPRSMRISFQADRKPRKQKRGSA
eukprot:scaffold1954_cov268-Pinguiococcus_pyrenoidosus.AAC.4